MKRLAIVSALTVLAVTLVFGQEEQTGEQGPTGEQGQQGQTGEQGPTGEQGQQGQAGEQGPSGQQGQQGQAGEQRPTGQQGQQGQAGEQGPTGEQGEVLQVAEFANQIWTYDFLEDASASGQQQQRLTVVDEFTRECLAFDVVGSFDEAIRVLETLIAQYGPPQFLHNHKSPEFVAPALQGWLVDHGIQAF